MGLLGRPTESAVWPQDPNAHTKRSPDRLLTVEASRSVRLRDKDGKASTAADLVHPSRIKTNKYATHKEKKKRGT